MRLRLSRPTSTAELKVEAGKVLQSGTSETRRGRGEKRSVGTVVVAAALAVVEGSPPGQQWSPSEGKRILLLIMNKDMKSISKRRG